MRISNKEMKRLSANKWVCCPFCHGVNELNTDYRKLYGKITAEKYQEFEDKYDMDKAKCEPKETLPLYYEIEITKEGVKINLSGECENCRKEWVVKGLFGTVK